jgi:hypothetical protein
VGHPSTRFIILVDIPYVSVGVRRWKRLQSIFAVIVREHCYAIDERSQLTVAVVKVSVLVLPSVLAGGIFRTHSKLAFSIGLFLGPFAYYLIPPRGKIKHFLILIVVCFSLGIVSLLLP